MYETKYPPSVMCCTQGSH